MKKSLRFIFLGIYLFNTLGCAPLFLGMVIGGVSVYAISKDTVQADTEKPYQSLWQSAISIGRTRGIIKQEDFNKGYIHIITSDSSKVWIRFTRLTTHATRLRVSVRRFHLPNLSLAQDICVKILESSGVDR
ncbi:MAG: hypothetical protein N2Z79_03220 [Candidatus Omnitrophica bacterium]|nr:hypothetical protein [Candidatus Omnitrophota bacterium]